MQSPGASDGASDGHTLDVYLTDDTHVADVRLDGESVYPTWFKIEWKETGELSAKIKGVRLATRYGDAITIHHGHGHEHGHGHGDQGPASAD